MRTKNHVIAATTRITGLMKNIENRANTTTAITPHTATQKRKIPVGMAAMMSIGITRIAMMMVRRMGIAGITARLFIAAVWYDALVVVEEDTVAGFMVCVGLRVNVYSMIGLGR